MSIGLQSKAFITYLQANREKKRLDRHIIKFPAQMKNLQGCLAKKLADEFSRKPRLAYLMLY